MKVPFVDLAQQFQTLKPEVMAAVERVFSSASFILGPDVAEFEKAFADYCGVKECVAVQSGTSALFLALKGLGIGPGDDVIVPCNSFIATAEAVSLAGAHPVFIDVDFATGLMDPAQLDKVATPKTKAVIPVHLYGQLADMEKIMEWAKTKNVLVLEDACQAHGAKRNGVRAGAWGAAAAFSFYPGKNLGAYGEGGAVVTNDADVAKKLRELRNHGSSKKYHHENLGYNFRLDTVQAAILKVKLPHLDDWNARRAAAAAKYVQGLAGVPGITPVTTAPGNEHIYHVFAVFTEQRDKLIAALAEEGIATNIHYPIPIHLQPAYAGHGHAVGSFPNAEKFANQTLSLPIFPELTDEQISAVCAAIKKAMANLG